MLKQCWETYFGQQLYKLVLLDLIVETGIIFFMQVPRWLVVKYFFQNIFSIQDTYTGIETLNFLNDVNDKSWAFVVEVYLL